MFRTEFQFVKFAPVRLAVRSVASCMYALLRPDRLDWQGPWQIRADNDRLALRMERPDSRTTPVHLTTCTFNGYQVVAMGLPVDGARAGLASYVYGFVPDPMGADQLSEVSASVQHTKFNG